MRISTRASCDQANSTRLGRKVMYPIVLASIAVGALVVAGTASAVGANVTDAQVRYQQDRAACLRGESHQDKRTCLREAGAALQEAKRGRLDDGDARLYEQNRVARCNVQPPDDREDCLRRMHGEGITSGSVEEGGVFHELVRTMPAQ